MARITAGVATSHVPALGATIDHGKTHEPYWEKIFSGYEWTREWEKGEKPDVNKEVSYNIQITSFTVLSL